MDAAALPLTGADAKAQGLLAGRQARCGCGALCPSEGPAPGFTDIPFFEYRGPGSKADQEQCKCGYYRVAHSPEAFRGQGIACKAFDPRGPHEFDSFYCGCRGWD